MLLEKKKLICINNMLCKHCKNGDQIINAFVGHAMEFVLIVKTRESFEG